ncbi:hypothetical protein MNBD_PLANCTO02-2650 [hydrothermal vent metagenome]|uniref:Uncharacterized protein n=1 Tax=hydrothermal vent metagenome TaxID=652676 RepID=A0A3B1DL01_9ZZZZ
MVLAHCQVKSFAMNILILTKRVVISLLIIRYRKGETLYRPAKRVNEMNRFLFQQWQTNARTIGSWLLLMGGVFLWVPSIYQLFDSQHSAGVSQSDQLSEMSKKSVKLVTKKLNHKKQQMAIK